MVRPAYPTSLPWLDVHHFEVFPYSQKVLLNSYLLKKKRKEREKSSMLYFICVLVSNPSKLTMPKVVCMQTIKRKIYETQTHVAKKMIR